MYRNSKDVLELTKKHNCSIAELLYMKEKENFEKSREDVDSTIRDILAVMRHSSQAAIQNPEEHQGHIIGGDAKRWLKPISIIVILVQRL